MSILIINPITVLRALLSMLIAGVILAILPASQPVFADDAVNINNLAVTPGESAAQCYQDATEHLRKGMWFERAATQLKEAIRQDPKNPDYHLALGCAYADRAASIGYAEGYALKYTAEVAQFPKDLADWKKAQNDPDDYRSKEDPPTPPPAFSAYTKDDQKLIDMPAKEAEAQMADLGKSALDEWDKAISLTKTPADRAHAEYVEGWGMYMLSWYADYDWFYNDWDADAGAYKKDGAAHIEVPSLPSVDDAADTLYNAANDDPKNAIYWQSVGDVDGPPEGNDYECLDYYHEALKLNPKNSLLWFYLASIENNNPKQAEEDARQAIKANPTNSFMIYLLAAREMQQTAYKDNWRNYPDDYEEKYGEINNTITDDDARLKAIQDLKEKEVESLSKTLTADDRKLASDAISLVEKGNAAPFCILPTYHPNVPEWLSVAFAYQNEGVNPFTGLGQIRGLARNLAGVADVAALQNDLPEAVHANQLSIKMALKLIGDWHLREQNKDDNSVILEITGMGTAAIGFSTLVQILEKYGNSDSAQAAQKDYDTIKDRITEWHTMHDQMFPWQNAEYADY